MCDGFGRMNYIVGHWCFLSTSVGAPNCQAFSIEKKVSYLGVKNDYLLE